MSLLFKNCLLAEATCLPIKFNETRSFLWKTKNADENDVNEQKTHSTHREKNDTRVTYSKNK